jgi:ABC-type branched-subunit amino acid transport system substrate-binding protein
MRLRLCVIATAIVVAVAGCGGDDSSEGSGDGGLDGDTPTTVAATNANCEGKTLTAPEIGVSETEITVTVVADVNNPIKPALFEGSWNGVKAWAEYMNSMGGLACRKVVVKTGDSKLNAEEAKNAVAAACTNSVALVGTTALFLQDVSGMESCKDKAGAATGIPDIAELQTEPAQQCSEISFATLPTGSSCPYSGSGPRTFRVGQTQYDYYLNKYAGEELHGVFVIPKDLPSTISATMPIYRAENQKGIKSDAEFGISGLATQPEYTQVVQAMKSNNSNYARSNLDYSGTVLMRKEAAAQNVESVKVWDCSVQCYDQRLITEGGSAVEGQYVWLNILPMEDGTGANPTLDAFIKYNKKPDGFGLQAFAAGMIFAEAVNRTMAANNGDPNSITRANLLTAIRGIEDFTAGGLVPPVDIGKKQGSVCLVGMQVQNGKFVRVTPAEKGTFDCGGDKPPIELTIDPVKEYKG